MEPSESYKLTSCACLMKDYFQRSTLLDATRISDNSLVMLKHIKRDVHPYEVEIGSYFCSEPLASHPRNHCIPIYEVLDIPDKTNEVLIVMPLLRKYDDPRMKSIGEAVEFFRQVFEVKSRSYFFFSESDHQIFH